MSKRNAYLLRLICLLCCLSIFGCTEGERPPAQAPGSGIVFKHGKIAGDPAPFRALLDRFESIYGIPVRDETLPASTDEQHQFYAINLEAGSSDFDVLSMDVIWVPEFARAGWIRDLSRLIPEEERDAFFPGPMEAVTFRGQVYAVPWYIDAGVLYYRKDLLNKYDIPPPRTWPELAISAS